MAEFDAGATQKRCLLAPVYTREGCKRIQEKLNDPTLAAEEQEKYTSSLDILKQREEKLREYADDEAFAKILNSGQ